MTSTLPNALTIENLSFSYPPKKGEPRQRTINSVTLPIVPNAITAIMGPSGCGKSTLLRCINRMNDTAHRNSDGKVAYEGAIRLPSGENLLGNDVDITVLRKRIGMVFQSPNPFPKSIFANIAYGPQIHGLARSRSELEALVKEKLQQVGLWEEVKDRLNKSATDLSGGQKQRLCIARAMAIRPDILLMDEPCSALDPPSTSKIEQLMEDLKEEVTIVIVTHSIAQAGRVADYIAYMEGGKLCEYGEGAQVLERPQTKEADRFVRGLIG